MIMPPGYDDWKLASPPEGREDTEGCPRPSRNCRCDDCQNEMADLAYDKDR